VHSPFRSESDVFRGAVLVLVGTVLAVAAGALIDPLAGGIVAGVLVGIAIGATLRAGRGSLPEDVEIASGRDGAYRILVVANQTLEGRELLAELRSRVAGHGPVEILVVTPSLPRSRLELIASDTDRARREASQRLVRSLDALRAGGFTASGSTGDEDPVVAARDALRRFGADEVVVSTHPPSSSRWLEQGVVQHLRAEVDLPVTHVVVEGKLAESAA
jgi:hypothetical protein